MREVLFNIDFGIMAESENMTVLMIQVVQRLRIQCWSQKRHQVKHLLFRCHHRAPLVPPTHNHNSQSLKAEQNHVLDCWSMQNGCVSGRSKKTTCLPSPSSSVGPIYKICWQQNLLPVGWSRPSIFVCIFALITTPKHPSPHKKKKKKVFSSWLAMMLHFICCVGQMHVGHKSPLSDNKTYVS